MIMIKGMRLLFIGLMLLAGLPGMARAQAEAEITSTIQQFLEAISSRDTTAFRAVMLPEALVVSTSMREGKPGRSGRGVEADINMLSREGPALLERAWEPEIRIDGLIATVWTRYDFHVDGTFSHCGTDAFQLIKTDRGWRIASVIYSIEPDVNKCPESPLGTP